MLVSDTHKFIFVHNPKTAGVAIAEALKPWEGQTLTPDPRVRRGKTKHLTVAQIKECMDTRGYFIFGFVRDPWDRFASLFDYLKRTGRTGCKTVNELALELTGGNEWLAARHSVKAQHTFFDESVAIGRYETLHADFARFMQRVGIDPPSIPFKNQGGHLSNREYNATGHDLILTRYYADVIQYGYHMK
jgi:hypothetical protein